ncbi:HEPN/Toprim-associated domain-containing protein [Urinicoccus massiliensis]|uniref:HEPN/Toprim-associated domain-containing protein n=1 Tax=Urinicoccus massiliensis TaxID=1723382 RepID=UPI000931D377|nr:HEPN/Toprim-associated domain-containing protein [Urinicoccus massiliensis]
MGSMITLGIGKMELDWGKNNMFNNHSCLFQKEDIKIVPYYYSDNKIEYKEGFSKNIMSVRRRLDLLGYSLYEIEELFNEELAMFKQLCSSSTPISFHDFYNTVINVDIQNINMASEEYDFDYDLGEYVRKCVIHEIKDLSNFPYYDAYTIGYFLENLDPYITLRILSENENNHNLDVIWRFADVVENGWSLEEDIIPKLTTQEKILIVTEGSSDTDIIKKSINRLYSDIADFFDFIDMEQNYPFTGTGNLKNFVKGLSKINILNKILVILDNDTAGISVYNDIKTIDLPNNLNVITLPNYKDFDNFKCKGPQGDSLENINGKAVSIECFLDHSSIDDEIYVRWTGFNDKLIQYQGNIEPKNLLIKSFHQFYKKEYDFTKLKYLVDYILESCTFK